MKPIELDLFRDLFTERRTLGALRYDGLDFAHVCEDPDRGLDERMSLAELAALKVPARTAIPVGMHAIVLEDSPKYGPDTLTVKVPGFRTIRIHAGNDEDDTEGCLCPGLVRGSAGVLKSGPAVAWLKARLVPHIKAGGEAWLRIGRDPVAWAAAPFNPARRAA